MPWISYAQNGEDVMLRRALADVAQGFYVDVGANDPRADSVTRAFYELGWSGINVEPVSHWFALLAADRPRDLNLQLAASSREGGLRLYEIVGTGLSTADEALAQRHRAQGREVREIEVPARRLDDILRDAGAAEVHFLKVDVEGAEAEVLRGLDLDRVRPWIVLVEATEPGSTAASYAQWEPLLTGKDYDFVWFDGLNRYYLAREHGARRAAFASPPNVFDDYLRYSEWLARQDVETLGRELEQARAALASMAAALGGAAPVQDSAAAIAATAATGEIATTEAGEAQGLAAVLAQAQAEAARARHEAAQARAALAEVYASRSWKASAPLRWLGALARRVLGRGAVPQAGQGAPGLAEAAHGAMPAGAAMPGGGQSPAPQPPAGVAQPSPAQAAARTGPAAVAAPAPAAQRPDDIPLDASARRVLDELQRAIALRDAGTPARAAAPARPRLAFVSPLPPARSGVADYAARLLPELARHYEIELIVERIEDVDPALREAWPVHDGEWFDRNAHLFDRRLYHVGNSLFHAWMLALLERHPGTVALHDVVLSDLLDHLERNGDGQGRRFAHAFVRALYDSHGYEAVVHDLRQGRAATVRRYAASGGVVAAADGVIVHSAYAARELAAWYGCADAVRVSALARAPQPIADRRAGRAAARLRLGLPKDAFVVCSFGVVAESKLSHRLLDAWFGSSLAADPHARLVFVGENDPGAYGAALRARIDAHDAAERVRFTGYASEQAYADHLLAADLAVQLRTSTRGESSGAIVDCLARGLPLIVNAHGPAADLPGDCVALLDDLFADAELVEALETLRADESVRAALAGKGQAHVERVHLPRVCAAQYRDAIEHFAEHGRHARRARLVDAVAAFVAPAPVPAAPELRALAAALAADRHGERRGVPRLLVDITAVAVHDLRSGIQRVVRAVLGHLLERAPEGWRVEPVYQDRHGYRHARRFTLGLLGADAAALDDDPVDAGAGDVFLGLDLVTDGVRHHRALYERWHARGAKLHFVVYDLLPVLHPQWFPDEAVQHYRGWLETVCACADGLVCISRAVRDELAGWLEQAGVPGPVRPRLGWFHLGGDLEASLPSRGLGEDAQALLERIAATPSFLMVGTVEPRKGHAQALAAFDLLWARGVDCRLLIVGRAGWMVDELAGRLRAHPQRGERLIWLENASDELLARCYDASAALLLASEGEGFGLPLIEAARHRLPIVARDLPVFREVAGGFATWFSGDTPEALADLLQRWLAQRDDAGVPQSAQMPWLSWQDATRALLAQVLPADGSVPPASPLHPAPPPRPHAAWAEEQR